MHLAEIAGPFPASRQEIMRIARNYGFDREVLHFLNLFPADEVFDSRADFITRCDEVELLVREERDAPEEQSPLSPLD
ncbi:MAG TPA: DUF2795 domain-containing protein [Candidatus Saccharimonadales bacterium]|nr:DUF2795 domain-containing protein [Candidatus Saccharimonadales bacterium]